MGWTGWPPFSATWRDPSDRDIAFVFQLYALYPHMTVEKNIIFPLEAENASKEVIQDRLKHVVDLLQIEHILDRDIRVVSTGEMRKVQIARVLIQAPDMLILDEPFDGMDRAARSSLAPIIDGLMDDSRTVILVTHRQREILPRISHVLAVSDGRVLFQGRRKEILTPSQMERLYKPSIARAFSLPAGSDNAGRVEVMKLDGGELKRLTSRGRKPRSGNWAY